MSRTVFLVSFCPQSPFQQNYRDLYQLPVFYRGYRGIPDVSVHEVYGLRPYTRQRWVRSLADNATYDGQLSYRKDDRAMRPIYGCHQSFESPHKRPWLLFPKFVMGFCSDRY